MEHTFTDSFLIGLLEFIKWAKWLLLTAVILIIGDLKFGIDASRYKKEIIKRSRAVRRTLDKLSSYLIWVVLSYLFGQAFGKPFGIDLLPLLMLLIIYATEVESIYVNYFAAKGKRIRINLFQYFSKKIDFIDFKKEKDNEEN